MTRRPVVAAVLAAGTGRRVGGAVPKQLLTLAGRVVLERSVTAFRDSPLVDRVLVIVAPDRLEAVRDLLIAWDEPGDLVFFHGESHVGIYIGGGQFVHAPHTGDVVKVSSLSDSWYSSGYDGAVRVG